MAVADHQKQWRSMVSEIPSRETNGTSNGISAVIGQQSTLLISYLQCVYVLFR